MGANGFGDALAGLGPRRVVVVSDRYPPDSAGGAELSLHLLLREPVLRAEALVVTFDKALAEPERRSLDGVDILALPAPAAWPLHRLSQFDVERLKRLPLGMKWPAYWAEVGAAALAAPKVHGAALALRLSGRAPQGGVAMDHATVPGGLMERRLGAVLSEVRPRLVHADNARAILVAAGALAQSPAPMLALVRDHRFTSARFDQGFEIDSSGDERGRAEKFAAEALAFRQARLGRADVVLATSRHLAETLGGVVAPEKLVQAALIPVEPPKPAAAPRCDGGALKLLLVGALTPNKGQARLLEAWPRLAEFIPGVEIDIAGAGADGDEIRRLIAAHGAERRVRLHGRVGSEALAALYRDADIVALPTLWSEPFGRVPLEAAAHGRPVVAYASGGLAETVRDHETGRLVPTGDLDGFVAALAELSGDRALRARMGEAGRAHALKDHAPAALAERLRGIWEDAILNRADAR